MKVETGRTIRPPKGVRRETLCQSCQQRIRYGEPRGHDTWAFRLSLTRDQLDLLLVGAAEFKEIHNEAVQRAAKYGLRPPPLPDPVAFVDWLVPSVLEADGAPQRNVDGSPAAHRGEHRHPDPLPFAGKLGGGEAA